MAKYDDLLKVIDSLRCEAPSENRRYYPDSSDQIKINQARTRAYIHMFLKVKFGLINFEEREALVN